MTSHPSKRWSPRSLKSSLKCKKQLNLVTLNPSYCGSSVNNITQKEQRELKYILKFSVKKIEEEMNQMNSFMKNAATKYLLLNAKLKMAKHLLTLVPQLSGQSGALIMLWPGVQISQGPLIMSHGSPKAGDKRLKIATV